MQLKKISIIFGFFILFIYLGLIVSSFYFFNLEEFWQSISSKRTLFAIEISVFSASISSVIAILIAIPAGYALSRYEFKGRIFIDVFLELPLIISPAALGAMILISLSSPLGNWFQENTFRIVYTFWGIVVAQFITILGIATRMVKSTMDEMPRRYEEVAKTLGASPVKAFTSITLPLSKQGLVSTFILTWAKAFGEFGATFTVAGTMAMKTETIPVAIFMKLSSANISGSIVMIMILISTGISLLFLTRVISKKLNYA